MHKQNNAGFTILELSFVLILFGLVSSTVFAGLQLYMRNTVSTHTDEAMDTTNSAIKEFYARQGRYPCPADPNLGPGDVNYGVEQCSSPPIAIVDGERDADNDDGDDDPDTGNFDQVMIGAVPFQTMLDPDGDPNTADGVRRVPITESLTIDGWGRKLSYAVSRNLADIEGNEENFDSRLGVIDVVDESGRSVLGEEKSAHFVIVTMGENGEGAYMRDGTRVNNCSNSMAIDGSDMDDPPPQTIFEREIQNCDETNGVFLSGLRNEQERYRNDDKVKHDRVEASSHWIHLGQGGPTNGNRIANTNARNVGIGVTEPLERLHVSGDIKANKVLADSFCDPAGYNSGNAACMPTSVVTGDEPQMKCGTAGTAVTAIQNNAVDSDCSPVFPPISGTPGFNTTCPVGQAAVGISNITGVICEAL